MGMYIWECTYCMGDDKRKCGTHYCNIFLKKKIIMGACRLYIKTSWKLLTPIANIFFFQGPHWKVPCKYNYYFTQNLL